MKQDDSGSAFPTQPAFLHGVIMDNAIVGGLTKREWFAGMALSDILRDSNSPGIAFKEIAKEAFLMADAMIEESKK